MEGPHHLPTLPWPSSWQVALSLLGLLQASQVVTCADGWSFACLHTDQPGPGSARVQSQCWVAPAETTAPAELCEAESQM